MILQKFYPNEYMDSTYSIDFKQLKQDGVNGLIFDIDNTLVPHGAPADSKIITLFQQLKEQGFRICLLSNNKRPRVESFATAVGVDYIFDGHKPSKKNYEKAMEIMNTTKEHTVFIGDQLFTDIYGANRVGIKSILVQPIHKSEEIQIVLKRYLEGIVLYFYKKNKKMGK